MKKSELAEMIRVVVKEEIDRALPALLMEVLAEKMVQQPIMENRAPAPRQAPAPTPAPQRQPLQAKKPVINLPKNPALAKVLAETVGGVPADADAGPMVSQEYTPGIPQQKSVLDMAQEMTQEDVVDSPELAGVLNVMNRNFASLVKAVDAKAASGVATNRLRE